MPYFVAALLGGLINIAATLTGKVVVALGFTLVSYTGISATLSFLQSSFIQSFISLPPDMVQLISYMGVGEFVSIIFSSLLAKQVLLGLTNGTVKRWVSK